MQTVSRRKALGALGAGAIVAAFPFSARAQAPRLQSWPLRAPRRTGIHDLAPAPDAGVWFSAQASGHLGYFDPAKGDDRTDLAGRQLLPARRDPGSR